jgi:hypothetical protein
MYRETKWAKVPKKAEFNFFWAVNLGPLVFSKLKSWLSFRASRSVYQDPR